MTAEVRREIGEYLTEITFDESGVWWQQVEAFDERRRQRGDALAELKVCTDGRDAVLLRAEKAERGCWRCGGTA